MNLDHFALSHICDNCPVRVKRAKTYLCTIMTQAHPNNLMLLHANEQKIDEFYLLQVGWDFITGREGRLGVFDYPILITTVLLPCFWIGKLFQVHELESTYLSMC